MIRDGFCYGAGGAVAGVIVGWLAGWAWAAPLWLLGLFALWFFRNPARLPAGDEQVVVSPADGKVTAVEAVSSPHGYGHRLSIFLSIFDVHVNRAPIAGRVTALDYRRGRFLNAMNPASSVENERNFVALEGPAGRAAFVQIAGLIARRIVFWPRLGESVTRGQLVGLIKFGSRVDVFLPADAELLVRPGDRVRGGNSALARLPVPARPLAPTAARLAPDASR